MDFLKAVNIIGRDLEEAMALLEQLSGVSGSDLAEIELARSRVRSAADLLKLLPALSSKNEKKSDDTERFITGPQAAVKAAEADARIPHVPDTAPPVTELLPPESPVVEKAAPVNAQKSQEPSKAILADRFVQGGTLGEKISNGKKEEVVSSVMQSKPITDIAAAIGINDRFYFIRELFSGDARAYSDTIGRLNAAASLGEAMKILDESTVMGSDPSAQSSFVDVVRRKFSLNV